MWAMARTALIVAHGQPTDPAPAEADLARLARAVAALLPDWQIGSATLAAPQALERAVERLQAPLVFPFFMADGWITRVALPDRLARAGAGDAPILPAFGLMAEVAALAATAVLAEIARQGWRADRAVAVLAAHGSGRSPAPAAAARAIADAVRAAGVGTVRPGFIEEDPAIADVAAQAGAQALCLPLFVARWGHVLTDLPAALSAAAFQGPCLDPIGTQPEVPGIIARALARASTAEPDSDRG